MTAQTKRFGIALLVVVACIVLPAISAVFMNDSNRAEPVSSARVLKNFYGPSENFAVDLHEHLAGRAVPSELPNNFETEFFDPATLGFFEAYSGEGVVGLYWVQDARATKDALVDLLMKTGWQHVGATEESSSYIKDSGVYRWLNMAVVETDSALGAILNFREGD